MTHKAVSYTHLDVYKRQAEKSARLAELDALLNMDDRGNDDPDCERTTEKPSVLAELRDRAGRIPVSYTHLDVYKRQ